VIKWGVCWFLREKRKKKRRRNGEEGDIINELIS